MKRRFLSLFTVLALLAVLVTPVFAQDYLFRVDRVDVNFYVNQDGTASVEYTYDFTNTAGGHVIDYVDIGLPNEEYDLGSITAEVDGQPISDIERSSYVDHGVALGLGSNSIQPGRSGRVHVWVPVIRNILNPATGNDANYTSFRFSPNYFGSQYVQGSTDMAVTLILPPGLTEDQPRYFPPQNWPGSDTPESSFTQDERIIYHWQSSSADSSSEYIFGASFPASVVPAAAIVQPSTTRSFGISEDTGGFLCCGAFGLFWVAVIGFSIYSSRKRKLQYLPPKIAVEGHGIKRGLTAVEAAVLMEQPVDRVMTMILFSVVKKNAAKVIDRDPVKIEAIQPEPEGLHAYETDFIQAFSTADANQRRKKLQDVVVGLVKSITEKMRGFSRKETLAYYENIMAQAWAQVEAADTPEVKSQKFDEYLGWTMLDKDYTGRTRQTFGSGPVFLPHWWGNWDPTYSSSSTSGSGLGTATVSTSGGGGQVSMPTLPGADFAASMVNGVQSFAAGVIGDVGAFTSKVTNVTNPPPPPSKSSYRGGGGGRSCACACACAGCACACAGGGR